MRLIPLVCALTAFAKPVPYAKVISVEGLVSAEPQHTNLQVGTELAEGDRVSVMSGSRVRLRLENGMVAELGNHTEAVFQRDAHDQMLMRISHGRLLAASKDGAALEIRSGTVKVRITGREFSFEAEGGKPTYVCAIEGGARASWGTGSGSVTSPGALLIHPERAEATVAKPRPADEASLKALRALL